MSGAQGGGEGPMYPVHQVPDPTTRTIETLEREVDWLQERADLQRESAEVLSNERLASLRREDAIREAHRLELKVDSERMLSTASIAAEKAVQAALAAAEKARDQQTIASQLATDKAEKAGIDRQEQQGVTFSTAINGLTTGLSDVKTMVSELRTEKKVTADTTTERRAVSSQMVAAAAVAAVLFSGVLGAVVAILVNMFGG